MIKNLITNTFKTGQLSCKVINLTQSYRQLNTSLCLMGVKGTEIKMPVLSPTMTEGTIVKWHKKEGDSIQPGDMICEVQTDKAIVGMELEEECILAKILINEDSKNVKIGEIIALYVEEGENWQDVEMPERTTSAPVSESKTESKVPSSKPQIEQQPSAATSQSSSISPSVRNLIEQYNIDANSVTATGPKNNLLKSDVLNYIQSNKLKQVDLVSPTKATSQTKQTVQKAKSSTSENSYVDIELSNMRRTIAKRLTESKSTIPHAYMNVACRVNESIEYQADLKKRKVPASFNDLIIKAVALALKKIPEVNSIFNVNNQQIELLKSVDISIAVATENGLITPIIKNANQLSIKDINAQVKHLATKARDGKLQPNEFIGGSFSISNLGMFGISEFSAVINPPQTAILAIGSPKPIVRDFDRIDKMLTCTLSYDARVLDEEIVAEFLESFKQFLQNPDLLESSGDGSSHRRLSYLV